MYPEEMHIDKQKYIREDLIKKENVVIEFTGEETIASMFIGSKVIVRSRNEGINAGIVLMADETGIVLKDARRLYYHKPLDNSVSWYEGVAKTGLHEDSKISCSVSRKAIIEDYSISICTESAFKNIMDHKPSES